jgi:regulatory protein
MSEITSIEPQKRRTGRFNVFVDGVFSFALSEDLVAREKIKIGQKITQEQIEKLIQEYEIGKILEKVFKFLSFRQRSRKEILDYLKKKKLGEKEIELVVKKLEKLGFINDEEFARFFIQSRIKGRPKGKRLLAQELRQKGVEKEIIEKILEEVELPEIELAAKAIEKKLKNFLKLRPQDARVKIANFLARRGFSWETIKELIDRTRFSG